MEYNAAIEAKGVRWLFIGGLIAVGTVFALYNIDEMLANSKYDQNLHNTLVELRTAQASLPSNVTDERQLRTTNSGSFSGLDLTGQGASSESTAGLSISTGD